MESLNYAHNSPSFALSRIGKSDRGVDRVARTCPKNNHDVGGCLSASRNLMRFPRVHATFHCSPNRNHGMRDRAFFRESQKHARAMELNAARPTSLFAKPVTRGGYCGIDAITDRIMLSELPNQSTFNEYVATATIQLEKNPR